MNCDNIGPQKNDLNVESDGSHVTMTAHGCPQSDSFTPSAQPMHDQSWRQDVCIYGLEGRDFPAGTPQIRWFNNMVTPLPFAAAQAGIPPEQVDPMLYLICYVAHLFILQDEDIRYVKFIAEYGRDATACPDNESEAPVLVLGLPNNEDQESIDQFNTDMRRALACGRPVVVNHWSGDPSRPKFQWTDDHLKFTLQNLNRDVIWQGMLIGMLSFPPFIDRRYAFPRCHSSSIGQADIAKCVFLPKYLCALAF
jgi:hypothetical protein